MSFSQVVRVRIEKDVVVRIRRSLKGRGKIFVSPNQEVTPADIIGSSLVSSGFRTLNLAKLLSVSPGEVKKYLKREVGKKIYKDELLASRKLLFGGVRYVIAPTDGFLDFFNPRSGEVRLTLLPGEQKLPAGVYGVVESVDSKNGQVTIKAQVTNIYGLFGSGRMRDGIVHLISKRDELVDESLVSPNLEGQILIGGSLIFKDAITAAISNEISGIVIGGINAPDYRGMAGGRLIFPKKMDNDIGLSIVVCEGFGSVPIGLDIYELLKNHNGRFATIDGNKHVLNLPSAEESSIAAVKRYQLPQVLTTNAFTTDLKVGLKVRIIGNSYLGNIGKLQVLDRIETLLPSGIKTFMATVETKSRKIRVSVYNIEPIL